MEMTTTKAVSSQDRLEKFIKALEETRTLQYEILTYSLDAAYIYLDDVEGDWLDNWGEDDDFKDSLITFLESSDPVALAVRKRLGNQSSVEMAIELEKCLHIPEEEHQRLFAIKTILADRVMASEDVDQEISLLSLAKELLEKLVAISELNY